MKEEIENLSESDKKLCQILASLEKVEAPKDFDFHLKARIAKADPKALQKSYARRFGYILPATGLAAVLTFAGLYGNFPGTNQEMNVGISQPTNVKISPQTSPTEEVASYSPNTDSNTSGANIVVPQIQKTPSIPPVVAFDEKSGERKTQPRNVKGNSNTSEVKALSTAPVLRPRGLDPDNRKEIPESQVEEKDFAAQEVFKVLGIETSMDKGSLKVKSLSPNSSAGRSGLKSDDVIESINGQKISNGKIRGKKLEVKKITVKRGAETVEIDLQAKPKP